MKKFLFVLLCVSTCYVSAQQTFPINDVASPTSGCYVLKNATIIKNAQTILNNHHLVIRKGKVESISTAAAPADAVVIDCKGMYIYPSFIDAYTDYGMPVRQQSGGGFNFGNSKFVATNKGAYSWNEAVRPETEAAKVFMVNDAKAKEYRSNGFGVVLSHVNDGIVRGSGTVVTLANAKENMVMLRDKASAHYSFNRGSSTQDYPNSQMGAIALLRQTYLDAAWYTAKPAEENTNLSLQAFNELQTVPQIFEAGDKWVALRGDKIAKEFNTKYIIVGGGNEYQRIKEIKNTGASFILPVALPQGVDVEDPNDARFVSVSDMQHWELAATNPAAFEKAGINFAFSSAGLKDAASFFGNIRKFIANGLSETKALEALTMNPATMLGIQSAVGSLDNGKLANFIVTNGPIFHEKTVLFQNWIAGTPYILKEDGFNDYRGNYKLSIGNANYMLELSGDAAKPSARIFGADTLKPDFRINDNAVNFSYTTKMDAGKLNRFSGINMENGFQGNGMLADGTWVKWIATKQSPFVPKSDSLKANPKKEETLARVNYPFVGFGNTELPKATNTIYKNATLWTCDSKGKLWNTDIHIQNGKIMAVGKNLKAAGAVVIDATGKHITPGIIDEHTHIAATGGINECSQSVTAEVRIGDVVNPDDINIYRQLSGGVTAAHILHGSCNTIGGQTQLIKMKWGASAEDMKVTGWPGYIKFALGENVKRSSANGNNRYPDTRMGVEQVLDDAFTRARAYQKMGAGKRRDLELETLVEILEGKRHITCHSYVQSEIVAMMRVAEKHGFKVNTFTHILEGYKVADKMKTHGAAASTFSDWWAYKMEVIDAIPQGPALMHNVGLNVAINSDDAEMARRLNHEAAKSVKYAGMKEEDALKMVTINPATMLRIGDRTGSLTVGKDADIVIWNDHPLSIYAKPEKTIVEGVVYFDRDKDAQKQKELATEKQRLVHKLISAKKGGERVGSATPSFMEEAMCEMDHTHGKGLWERIERRMTNADHH